MGHTGGAGRQEGSSGFDCSLGNALHSFFRIKHIRKRESSVNNVVYKGRGSECQAIRVGGGGKSGRGHGKAPISTVRR